MNWEAAGAIGEILGAIAVVATLIYLSRQVSATKIALRRQQSQEITSLFNESHNLIAGSTALSNAMAKLEAGSELTGGEAYQIRHMFLAVMNAFDNFYIQSREKDALMDISEVEQMIIDYLNEPWIGDLWNENSMFFSDGFRAYVNSIMQGPDDA